MAYFDATYRFLLNGIQCYPYIGDEFNIEWAKESDSFYFRKSIGTDVKLVGDDYDSIYTSNIETKHTFVIQKNNDSVWEDWLSAYFYKTDCEFDNDSSILKVQPTTDDGYEELDGLLNNEYSLVEDLAPPTSELYYHARPLMQIIIYNITTGIGGDTIINVSGNTSWEEDLSVDYDDTELTDTYYFEKTYYNERFDIGVANYYYYVRYLTTKDTFDGNTTIDRPSDDISESALGYTKICNVISEKEIRAYNGLSASSTKWGKLLSCSTYEDYYYDQPSVASSTLLVPLSTKTWKCLSMWHKHTESINQTEIANSDYVTLSDAYEIADVISALLAQETDITFEATTDFSEFFYSTTNPVTGEANQTFMITPKSNVVNLYYTSPARTSDITLTGFLNMLNILFNVYWHVEIVDGEKRFRIEHVSWYEKGGNYSINYVDLDLTQQYDKRNGFPLSYYQNTFSYNKPTMPYRYEFSWMDDVSTVFEGHPIDVLSNHVEKGNIKTYNTGSYTSDLDMILYNDEISLDGFAMFATELSGSDYVVPYVQFDIGDYLGADVQNGSLSFRYLHPAFHGYGKPAESLLINEEEYEADSITRNKQQELSFAYQDIEIDPLKLIRTELGEGQVEEMTLNLVNNKYEMTINHDTE